jgi:circadian clock protein KaiC
MSARKNKSGTLIRGISKCPTGIKGLDQITEGGLPKGRPTLICGSSGCGKTMLAVEFLVRGATEFGESGVFMSFEETSQELSQNVASLGFNLAALCARKKLRMDFVRVERNEIQESGAFDLEGIFIRLGTAIDELGAKRVVLDTIENLFSGFSNMQILRAELRRLFTWLKAKGVTAVITAESGGGKLTRDSIEEYVADCVIMLDHRVEDENSVRRLRIVKYRGSLHGTSEYPFLIGKTGFSVMPLSSLTLDHTASLERLSTGVPSLDTMLGGKGFYRGTSVLLSGVAGTGKSSLAAHFVLAACQRGERALYISSEQSPDEVIRNMRSIGIDLQPWLKKGLLRFYATRAGSYGLERHLVTVNDIIDEFNPHVVVIDPVTSFSLAGSLAEVKSMVTRLIDMFKSRQVTALFTSLTSGDVRPEMNEISISSQMDTWLLLRNLESNGERNRGLYVSKSRGMEHSNQIREFIMTEKGVQLLDVYVGSAGLATGSARVAMEANDRAAEEDRKRELRGKAVDMQQKRQQLEAQIANLRCEFELEAQSLSLDAQRLAWPEGEHKTNRIQPAEAQRTGQPALAEAPRLKHQFVLPLPKLKTSNKKRDGNETDKSHEKWQRQQERRKGMELASLYRRRDA